MTLTTYDWLPAWQAATRHNVKLRQEIVRLTDERNRLLRENDALRAMQKMTEAKP